MCATADQIVAVDEAEFGDPDGEVAVPRSQALDDLDVTRAAHGLQRLLAPLVPDRDPEAVLRTLRIGAKPAPARAKRARIACSWRRLWWAAAIRFN
jgi:hypothetical protein